MASEAQRSSSSFTRTLVVKTSRRTELRDVTAEVESAARDIEAALDRLVPHSAGYTHAEGNADSHIKTALIGSSETVWIERGRLLLGRWQAGFFAECDGPRSRELHIKIVSDGVP